MRNLPIEILVFRIEPNYDDGNDDIGNDMDEGVDPDSGNSND